MLPGLSSRLKFIPPTGLLRAVRSLALGLLLLPLALAAKPIKFEIPAEPAASALLTFSKQAGVDVLYSFKDLNAVTSQPLSGEFEPEAALAILLKETGFHATRDDSGKFVVTRESPHTGTVASTVVNADTGKPVEGARIRVVETALIAITDHAGRFQLTDVPAGTYSIVVLADDFMPTRVTDVSVRADSDVTLGLLDLRPRKEGVTQLAEYVVSAKKDVVELESYEVTDAKIKPFSTANVDIARTINDAQPYYIFDSKTLDQSGAVNVEDFLKQRLTMNATALSNAQVSGANPLGNIGSVNLRGLGADKTLILVDGRRMAGVTVGTATYQPDINGIPLSAIDRIEVLPSSASGIYGGSAIGGVVNIILKKDYAGGEVRVTYDNTFNTDSPTRTVSASYGWSLEGGKTHVMLSAAWSDANPLLLQDRRSIFDQNQANILTNYPGTSIYNTSFVPFLGSLPNITNDKGHFTPDFTGFIPNNLVLKPAYGGTTLSSGITHINQGTTASTSAATLAANLVANAGSWNTALPASTQSPTGLLQSFGATPESKSFQASVNRQMLPKLELFADFSYSENSTKSVYNPNVVSVDVSPNSPVNPFTTYVGILVPDSTAVPITTKSETKSFTVGAIAQLPWSWTGELDYSWSENRFSFLYYNSDADAMSADIESGALNPFVDTLQFPPGFGRYLSPYAYSGSSTLDDIALRGSGPLGSLPWGVPNLTIGLEHRSAKTPQNTTTQTYAISTDEDNTQIDFARQSVTDSAYGELTVPLVKKDVVPLMHTLELQLSGRGERYKVDTGTSQYFEFPSDPGSNFYNGPTLDGQPYFSKASYTSTNGTAGLKFQPVPELTLRTSVASAFLPPDPGELIKNPEPDQYTQYINDPTTGTSYAVKTISGGNPNLKPQTSKSFNAGVIWEPRASALKGLRFDAEFYHITQNNAISTLGAQNIIDLAAVYPGRVVRDTSGLITLVDTSSLNLYKRETEGWDLSADYTFKTGIGTFNLMTAESIVLHLKNQYDPTLPEYDAVNFPSEDGAAKYKANATLGWEWHNWAASWTARYFSSYKQYGAAGGPDSTQNNGGAEDPTYIQAQGSDTIPSQTYHDVFVSYAFGKQHASSGSKLHAFGYAVLDGLTVQLGVRNVFNKVPPFDYYYSGNYYESPYGDLRLRSYWISLKKAF